MKKSYFLILFVFLVQNLKAQEILKPGDKAPQINITDYILNIPDDKNLENKYIVLEFWATWCAPCLGAVPHLNALQAKYKSKKNLVFLSLTYENPEKTRKTLERIEFKTVVVSDQTKKTEKNFNVRGIPHTVLIDNKGIIKWIGTPLELTDQLMEDFLNQKAINVSKIDIAKDKEDTNPPLDFQSVLKILKDTSSQFTFILEEAKPNDEKFALDVLFKGKYTDVNNHPKSIISKIIKKPESQIAVPNVEKKYNLIYKNLNDLDLNEHNALLKDTLLKTWNLTERIEQKVVEVYKLKLVDEKKLVVSLNQNEENHSGQNDTHLIFSNAEMETFAKNLGEHYQIIIFNETGFQQNLDFIIKKGTLKELNIELAQYGLQLEQLTKELEFYIYN